MLPFSLQCGTCGNYMYKGTKFNASKEEAGDYLGIPIWRFYFRCSNCSAELAMKTDPKNADYVCELGARRNFEPWKEEEREKGEQTAAREDEERGDAMRALENRTMDNRREMDTLNALEEDLALNAQHAGVSTRAALEAVRAGSEAGAGDGGGSGAALAEGDDEEEALRRFRQQREGRLVGVAQDLDGLIDGDGWARAQVQPSGPGASGGGGTAQGASQAQPGPRVSAVAAPRILVVKRKSDSLGEGASGAQKKARPATSGPGSSSEDRSGGLLGLGGYSSDE